MPSGATLFAIWAAGVAIGAGGENAVTVPGLLLVGGPWWYGVIDAHRAVARDARRRASRASVTPWAPPLRGHAGARAPGPRVGVLVRVAF